MVALRGSAANHIATFWSDVNVDNQSAIQGLFKSKLSILYTHEEVRQWLVDHLQLVTEEVLRVAYFFDKHDSVNHRMHLECLRVCELPSSLSTYSLYVEHYAKSNKAQWIGLSL